MSWKHNLDLTSMCVYMCAFGRIKKPQCQVTGDWWLAWVEKGGELSYCVWWSPHSALATRLSLKLSLFYGIRDTAPDTNNSVSEWTGWSRLFHPFITAEWKRRMQPVLTLPSCSYLFAARSLTNTVKTRRSGISLQHHYSCHAGQTADVNNHTTCMPDKQLLGKFGFPGNGIN